MILSLHTAPQLFSFWRHFCTINDYASWPPNNFSDASWPPKQFKELFSWHFCLLTYGNFWVMFDTNFFELEFALFLHFIFSAYFCIGHQYRWIFHSWPSSRHSTSVVRNCGKLKMFRYQTSTVANLGWQIKAIKLESDELLVALQTISINSIVFHSIQRGVLATRELSTATPLKAPIL